MMLMDFEKYEWGTEQTWRKNQIVPEHAAELVNALFGLSGEVGELVMQICFDDPSRDKVVKELGDVLYYTTRIAAFYKIPLREIGEDLNFPTTKANEALMRLAGVSGELVDLIKKDIFHGVPASEDAIREKLVLIFYHTRQIGGSYGVHISEVAVTNYNKLAARYPGGFTFGGGIR